MCERTDGPRIDDARGFPACLNDVLEVSDRLHWGSRSPILQRLRDIEVLMQWSGCSLAPPPKARPARQPGLDSPVGPPDFVESLWAQLEASPALLQVQPVGVAVDPKQLQDLYEKCLTQDDLVYAERYSAHYNRHIGFVQNWTFCDVRWVDAANMDEDYLGRLLKPLL